VSFREAVEEGHGLAFLGQSRERRADCAVIMPAPPDFVEECVSYSKRDKHRAEEKGVCNQGNNR
jgi:hypothetical protein